MPPELFKKISALRNLSDAIHQVREHLQKDAKVLNMRQPQPTAPVKIDGPLEHLGRKATQNGVITHMIGRRGTASPYYEIQVDAHKMGKVPHIAVAQIGVNGGLISRHPQRFRNVEDAVKSASKHSKSGVWE